jgi:hypothetical protein
MLQQVLLRVIKSTRMRLVANIARMGEMRNALKTSVGKIDHPEVIGIDGKIILKWVLRK